MSVVADAFVGDAHMFLMILARGLTLLCVAVASCTLIMWHASQQSPGTPNPTKYLLFGLEMGWKAAQAAHAVQATGDTVSTATNVIQFPQRPVAASKDNGSWTGWSPGYAAMLGPGPGRSA